MTHGFVFIYLFNLKIQFQEKKNEISHSTLFPSVANSVTNSCQKYYNMIVHLYAVGIFDYLVHSLTDLVKENVWMNMMFILLSSSV